LLSPVTHSSPIIAPGTTRGIKNSKTEFTILAAFLYLSTTSGFVMFAAKIVNSVLEFLIPPGTTRGIRSYNW